MKLRNKKTGEIALVNNFLVCDVFSGYKTLSDFLEEWEDYEQKEPLIKDEKIRKAVRAWAEAESMPSEETVFYNGDEYSLGWYKCEIMFSKHIKGLREKEYTIAELCGEDER